MGKHIPMAAGLATLAVAIPLIIWDASRTSDELDRDAHVSRYEACRDKSHELGLPLHKAQPFCRCVTDEAKKRGAERVYGSYDNRALTDIVNMCAAANGFGFVQCWLIGRGSTLSGGEVVAQGGTGGSRGGRREVDGVVSQADARATARAVELPISIIWCVTNYLSDYSLSVLPFQTFEKI